MNPLNAFVIQSGDLIREGGTTMWTAKNRGRYDRSKLRYPSDLTDDEYAHVEPLITLAKRGGNKRHVVREVMNGIMYILSTGCRWACDPEGSAAAQHTFRLSRLVELRRYAGSHPSRALCGVSGARRSQPERRHRR
jgi:hypothetical protein